jgi:hypothetical protein
VQDAKLTTRLKKQVENYRNGNGACVMKIVLASESPDAIIVSGDAVATIRIKNLREAARQRRSDGISKRTFWQARPLFA